MTKKLSPVDRGVVAQSLILKDEYSQPHSRNNLDNLIMIDSPKRTNDKKLVKFTSQRVPKMKKSKMMQTTENFNLGDIRSQGSNEESLAIDQSQDSF